MFRSKILQSFALLALIFMAFGEEQNAGDELVFSAEPNIENSLSKIHTLEDHCEGSICRNFYYPDLQNVAFFDPKESIRIFDDETYEVRESEQRESVVFLNSTFAHFPLHLFYAMGTISEVDMRNCSIELITWESLLMASKLQVLLLSQNKLRTITESTFSYASELQFLFLDDNQIRLLDSDSFRGLSKLRYLNLANNRLRELPGMIFASLTNLHEINLAGNRLHYLPNELFSRNKQLQSVVLRDNKLRQLDEYIFKSQANMIFVDISDNRRLGRLIVNVQTQFFYAKNCSLYLVNLYGGVENADLRDNQIVELYFSQPEKLEKLVLRNNALQQIASLAKATNLHELDVADNPALEYLPDPWSVNSLERLDLSNTSLKQLPISNLAEETNLRWLNVSCNKLRVINPRNFKYLEQLTHFYIDNNEWNCYNLRLLMDILIKPKRIVYKFDKFDGDFPGEYIEGIACMYMDEDSEEGVEGTVDGEQDELKALLGNLKQPIKQIAASDLYETTNEYPTVGNTEEQKLRNQLKSLESQLKAIVQFYESKFDKVFDKMESLNQRIAAFERMNATMFQHITIST